MTKFYHCVNCGYESDSSYDVALHEATYNHVMTKRVSGI